MRDLEHLHDQIQLHSLAMTLAAIGADSEERSSLLFTLSELQLRIEAREAEASDLASRRLTELFGLSSSESRVLWSLAALALSFRARAFLGGSSQSASASMDDLRAFVYGESPTLSALRELGEVGTLRRFGLIEIAEGSADVHESRQRWAISNRVLAYLHGDPSIDAGIAALCVNRRHCLADALATSSTAIADVRRSVRVGRGLVVAAGMPGLGRRTLLASVAKEAGIEVLEIDARRLAKDSAVMAKQLRAIARECKLLARAPLICNIDALVDEKEDRIGLVGSELVSLLDGLVLVTCGVQRPQLRWDRPVIVVEMGQPTTAQRAKLWREALGQGTDEDAELLATQYPLAPALIHHAAEAAKARANGRQMEPEDIYAGIRAVLDDRLGQYARRVTVTQSWEDLVLPPEQVESIVELMARIRERRRVYEEWGFAAKVGKGLGVSALFSGPPGTGKTMVAALIARDLGIELYQVDLAKIVSKWVGETEKNLAALFDAAEAGHAILLFDEADALFGKRTDVKSSNDRYANLETNYLLQRLESFTGICLLTSNHESHIDPAFQRRLSLHLRFDLPNTDERAQLWRAMLPAAAPVAPDVDFAGLAKRYAMSGGYIRNAALRAAFLAANDRCAIGAAHLERAARVEYEGMGKIAA